MSIVLTCLILLLVVALSGVLVRLSPLPLPLPLVQIALGALLALPMFGLHVQFDHELFFLLFIPPLLFADGWRLPQREFFKLRRPILMLALGLVFFTVLGVGYFVHWMIPAVPLAAAFALASVLSPTDAVAVSSIGGGSRMPERMGHILGGEALMNDASGLVSLQFAITAALTGVFVLHDAALKFVLVAAGGLAVGFAVTWLFGKLRARVVRWSGELDPPSHVALLLLLPFAAYLLAEHLGVSGILAAVAAGMTMNSSALVRDSRAHARMQGSSVWGMLEFVFNGVIFLLLGLQLPWILGEAQADLAQAGGHSLWQLPGYVLAITLALLLLRFFWVWATLRLNRLVARLKKREPDKISVRALWVVTLAGVRGAITLAGVLSLPLSMPDGSDFPARGLLIFLATGVILATLLIGSIGLPLALKRLQLPPEDPRLREERMARARTAEAALKAIDKHIEQLDGDEERHALVARIGSQIKGGYEQRVQQAADEDDSAQRAQQEALIERDLRMVALRAEREAIHRLRRHYRINDQTARRLTRELDLAEVALGTPLHHHQ